MDNFEHYIKQQFENFTEEPSPQLWTKISKQIRPWYAKPWAKVFIGSVVSAILITMGIIAYNNKYQPVESLQINPGISTVFQVRQPEKQDIQKHTQPQQSRIYYTGKPKIKIQPLSDSTGPKQSTDTFNTPETGQILQNKIKGLAIKLNISPKYGCAPLDINFSVSGVNGMEVNWLINKMLVSQDSVFTKTFQAGVYFVQVVLYDSTTTIIMYDTIEVEPAPVANFEAEQCTAGKKIKVKNLSKGANCFIWIYGDGDSEKSDTPTHIYTNPGVYKLQLIARNNSCADTVSDLVVVAEQPDGIIFPNAFVPSTSGPTGGFYNVNKPERTIFHPVIKKPVKTYSLQIYDRRGKLLFSTNNVNQGWDGYYRGKLVPIGVYIYVAQGVFEDGETFVKKGDITVIYK